MNILFAFFIPSGGVETLNRQRFYALNCKGVNCHFLYRNNGIGLLNNINTSIFVTNEDHEIKEIILKGNYAAIVVCSDIDLIKKIRDLGYEGVLIYENQGLGIGPEDVEFYLKNQAFTVINEYCDGILYPQTQHLIQAFEKNFKHKKKFCFHNCFNIDEFKYQVHPRLNHTVIGWVGRLEENKNWRSFLLIGSSLIKENPSIRLWIFEDNTLSTQKERTAFTTLVNHLKLNKNLTIYANQPHHKMAKYFSVIGDSGGFLCSTSKVEGFGYAVLEAMICKCPVLATDSDGVRSLIKHNITGKFFNIGDIEQAVKEGKELMSNIPLREKIRREAVDHIERNFTPERYAENFLNMINNLNAH